MKLIASALGIMAAALAALAAFLLYAGFRMDFTVGSGSAAVANLSLMHVQAVLIACGLTAALGSVVLIAASGIVWAMTYRAH
jgi:hypothetical protein